MSNKGVEFDEVLSKKMHVKKLCKKDIEENCSSLNACFQDKDREIKLLLKSIAHLDLTSLTGTETISEIEALCAKADNPLTQTLISKIKVDAKGVKCAAVCVYEKFAADCVKIMKAANSSVNIAVVAGDFPNGQLPLHEKLDEVKRVHNSEANEIDVVIDKNHVLEGDWKALYDEVKAMKEACGENLHMKVIIKSGDLGSLDNIYSTSIVCMAAGADFIKTSTGKEAINATLPVGTVMSRAIKHYYQETGIKVGFKPAGGIRTANDTLQWFALIEKELGNEWLSPSLFRIGASSLLSDIVQRISELITS